MASKPKPDFTGSVSEKVSDVIHGKPAAPPDPPGQPNVIAKPLSIFQIAPDPKQPRRQIPSVIRQQWNGDPQKMIELFAAWSEGFAEEAGREGDEIEGFIGMVLDGKEISSAEVYQGELVDVKRNWGVIGGSLMAVVNLAAEIRRDGLTNPITVVRDEGRFLIETGERRWLAFHLLHIFYNTNTAWTRIPAREMPASSVWRQAGENTARAQLNAISMARQLAILLMDLYTGVEDFLSFDEVVEGFPCDRAYYAQVGDGNRYRIPRGKGEQLVSAMGKSGEPDVLRKYRDLLRLPDEVWMLADDLNWTEYFIRAEIVEKAVNENGMISLAQFHADKAGYRVTGVGHTVPTGTVSDEAEGEIPDEKTPESLDDEADLVEIKVGDWVKTTLTGDELFQVKGTIPKDSWNQWVTLFLLHNDEMPEGAEIKAQREDLIPMEPPASNPDPDQPNDSDDDEPTVDPSLEFWQVQVLEFAYAQAEAGTPWFAAKDSPSHPERLNQLIGKHLLRGRSAYTNTNYATAFYSIAGAGCLAIGQPFLPTPQPDQRKPVSGGEFHAGNDAPVQQNPPVQTNPNEATEQAKLERKVREQLTNAINQFGFALKNVAIEKMTTQGGQLLVKDQLDQVRNLLLAAQKRLPSD